MRDACPQQVWARRIMRLVAAPSCTRRRRRPALPVATTTITHIGYLSRPAPYSCSSHGGGACRPSTAPVGWRGAMTPAARCRSFYTTLVLACCRRLDDGRGPHGGCDHSSRDWTSRVRVQSWLLRLWRPLSCSPHRCVDIAQHDATSSLASVGCGFTRHVGCRLGCGGQTLKLCAWPRLEDKCREHVSSPRRCWCYDVQKVSVRLARP